jgi:hypothetical protein
MSDDINEEYDYTELRADVMGFGPEMAEKMTNFTKKENSRIKRYRKIQTSMDKSSDISNEDFVSNYRVHRIVFENILVDEENKPEGTDRSLSIPFDGKMRPVWAPNGYGKTFAFKLLALMHENPYDAWNPFDNTNIGESYWKSFILRCARHLYPSVNMDEDSEEIYQDSATMLRNSLLSIEDTLDLLQMQQESSPIVPFVSVKVRLVGEKLTSSGEKIKHVIDLSITPEWNTFIRASEKGPHVLDQGQGNQVLEIRKKFWIAESLESLYYKNFPDEELEAILLNKEINLGKSTLEPTFLENSFKFPKCEIIVPTQTPTDWFYSCSECGNSLAHDEISDDDKCPFCDHQITSFDPVEVPLRDASEIIPPILNSLRNYHLWVLQNKSIASDSKRIIEENKEYFDKLNQLKDMNHKEKEILLIETMRLSEKYPNFDPDDFLPAVFDNTNYIDTNQRNTGDFQIICTLLDIIINGTNEDPDPDDFSWDADFNWHSPRYGLEEFNSFFQQSSLSWRTFDRCFSDFTNPQLSVQDESIVEAVRMLGVSYFEIPSEINYSSNTSLERSQYKMETMLQLIQQEYKEAISQIAQTVTFASSPPPSELNRDILQVISDRVDGGRLETIDNFFEVLGIKSSHKFSQILNELNHIYSDQGILEFEDSGLHSPQGSWNRYVDDEHTPHEKPFFMPDLTDPIFESVVTKIIKFTEIYQNINDTLNSKNSSSWAANCRFKSLQNPLAFNDPLNDYEIKEKHLSFGQRSVIVSEVCLGFAMFLDPKKGYLYHNIHDEYPRIADLQLNFIIDEPEIGRSEYWVNKVAERIISTNQFLEDNKSMMIVSHRETLLRTFSLDSRYHIMQPKESVLEEE